MLGQLEISKNGMRPIWFEPFLQELKLRLGYQVDIDKYNTLLRWMESATADGSFSLDKIYAVCKLLFLENIDHLPEFNLIYLLYIATELNHELRSKAADKKERTGEDSKKAPVNDTTADKTKEEEKPASVDTDFPEPKDRPETARQELSKKYLNITIPPSAHTDKTPLANTANGSSFLFTDAYLPLTKREMIHGWRNLRKKMQWRQSTRLDVKATVKQIATEGILLNPVFERELVNSDDLLLILADRKGSMQPFHKLTDTLIETAIKDGGHKKAQVYYFYNCPVGYVYKNKNLTDPVPLLSVYSKIRADHTNALIISDAGAMRGNLNKDREEQTINFLKGKNEMPGIHKAALFVAWLNPVPRQRWAYTTAAKLDQDKDTPMFSIMDEGYGNFLRIIEKLMGR